MAMQQPVEVKSENDSDLGENEFVQVDEEPPVNVLYEELISEVVIDEQIVFDDDMKAEEKEEIEVATTMLSMSGSSTALNDAETEEESEEACLMNGFIPIQECEVQIFPKRKPQTGPKKRIPPTEPKKHKPHPGPKKRKPATYHVCPICGTQTTALAVHMRTHSNDRPFACDMCDLKFYTSGKLRCHYDSVHIAERKFSCDICGKAFVLKKNLKAHMLSHSNKREHVCSQCSKSFLFRWSLTAHERIHTGERPYACTWEDCGKRFVTVSNLIQHQKTANHSEVVAVEICSLCLKAFQTQAALKAHRTKTHGTEKFLDNVTNTNLQ